MKSLKALHSHLQDLELIHDLFDSWAQDGELDYSGAQVLTGLEDAVLLYRLEYTAVFNWESWGGDAYRLFAEVVSWLEQNGHDFDELGNPEFDVEIVDDDTADVEIRIHFIDPVYRVTGPDGVEYTTDEPQPTPIDAVSTCGGLADVAATD